MGFNEKDDLKTVPGEQTVGTAKKGANLTVLGQLRRKITIKIGDHETRFKDQPMVLDGLAMDFNLSGPFLRKHNINQLHDQDCLGIQGQHVPLICTMNPLVAPPEEVESDILIDSHVVVPARSIILAPIRIPAMEKGHTPPGDVIIRGGTDFMRKTDLHPWMNALVTFDQDGTASAGVMNTTDEPLAIDKGTKYGTGRLITTSPDKEYPWRISILEPKANPKPMTEREVRTELPSWMKGATNAGNQERRLQYLIDKFELKKRQCLKTPNDVLTAGLLLLKYWDTFSFDGSFGRTTLLKHTIRLNPGQQPINQRFRPVNPALEGDLRKQLDEWLEHGVIEKSNSPWNFGLVAAPKKNGKVRWCIDFRELNKATVPSTTPIGNIEDNLAKLARSSIFSGLDGTGAFHVVDLEDQDKEKTSFATPWGSFQFKQMPFGLSGAPSTYARLVNMILDGMPHDQVLPYLDDTVIHSSTLAEHLQAMDRVMMAMRKAGLKLQPDKCQLFQEQIDYLGHRVTKEGICPIPEYVQVVKEWPMPTTRTAIRAFLGKAGYYRRFIKDYAGIAGALYEATTYPEDDDRNKKVQDKLPLEITPAMKRSFQRLKDALISAPILAYPDFNSKEPFILDTDWSLENNAVGGVLSQKQDGAERVICYGAKKLSPSQANYPSTKGELCAIIVFLQKWSYFLRHRPFHLRTDNQALKWIHTMEAPKGMVQRWLDILANHQFTVEHRPGTKHANADSLSRAPHLVDQHDTDVSAGERIAALTVDENEPPAPTSIQPFITFISAILGDEQEEVWNREFLVKKQEEDEELQLIANRRREDGQLTREELQMLSAHGRVWAGLMANFYTDHTGLTRYRYQHGTEGSSSLIVLPQGLWKTATQRAHEDVAHMGITATAQRVLKHFYFPGVNKMAEEVVQGCAACQKRNNKPQDQKHTLRSHQEGFPFQKLSLDFVGPLPRSTHGNEYLFTIRDTFTRWVEAFPIKRATADIATKLLVEQIFPRFGFAEQIHSDRGSQFTGQLVTDMARTLGIKATTTPAYNPKSNPVERVHRDIGRAIKALVQERPNQWEEVLPHVLFVIRTTPCRSTGLAPYKMLFGRDATVPLDLIFGPPPYTDTDHKSDLEYVNVLRNRIESAHAWARRNMSETIQRQRRAYYKDRPTPFIPGQQVWLFTPVNVRGQRTKFNTYWTGPWTIKRKVNDLCYEILPDTRWTFYKNAVVVSIDRLKKWYPEECAETFTQPPQPGMDLQLKGDEFAENVTHNEYNDEEEAPPLPQGGPIGPPPPGAPPNPPGMPGAPPGPPRPGAPDLQPNPPARGRGRPPRQPQPPDNNNSDSDEGGEEVVVGPRRQAWQPHGPRIDAERNRLQAQRDQARRQAEDMRNAREQRQAEREEAAQRNEALQRLQERLRQDQQERDLDHRARHRAQQGQDEARQEPLPSSEEDDPFNSAEESS